MTKLVRVLLIVMICIVFPTVLFAQDNNAFAISKEAKTKLKTVKIFAIFLNGNDPLLTRIVEDAVTIYLTNIGFTVINREVLEKSVGEQVAKKKKEKTEGAINALEIGSAVNADFILTGTIVIESGEQRSLLTKVASFQVVDVPSGKTMINVLFESEKGNSLSETAMRFADILKQNIE